jgi:hypothetical protein
MDKTHDFEQKNNSKCKYEGDYVFWEENLKKELPHFWNYLANRDKRLFVQCLLSLWLFTIITNVMMKPNVL